VTHLPSISIVVPNLNGGETLGATLSSLVEQRYPDLEILVVDGGSQDGSLDVIRRFQSDIAWWVSESDRGQTHAINKGFARAGGDIVNWLCSDDVLLPGALGYVGRVFRHNPELDVLAGAGNIVFQDAAARNTRCSPGPRDLDLLPAWNGIMQQSCFWRRALMCRKPPLDESFHYAMDMEFWCWLKAAGAHWDFTPAVLSRFIMSGVNKSSVGGVRVARELERVYRRYTRDRIPLSFWYRFLRYPFERALRRDRGLVRLALLRVIQAAWMAALMPFYGFGKVRYMSWPE